MKVGETVKCIKKSNWPELYPSEVGKRYVIKKINDKSGSLTFVGYENDGESDAFRFELVTSLDANIELINNALKLLHSRQMDLEWADTGIRIDLPNPLVVRARKRKAVDLQLSTQIAKIVDDGVELGGIVFHKKAFVNCLQPLVNGDYSASGSPGIELKASRKGIWHYKFELTWADADQLLAELSK